MDVKLYINSYKIGCKNCGNTKLMKDIDFIKILNIDGARLARIQCYCYECQFKQNMDPFTFVAEVFLPKDVV